MDEIRRFLLPNNFVISILSPREDNSASQFRNSLPIEKLLILFFPSSHSLIKHSPFNNFKILNETFSYMCIEWLISKLGDEEHWHTKTTRLRNTEKREYENNGRVKKISLENKKRNMKETMRIQKS
jgi:hypothetical protein